MVEGSVGVKEAGVGGIEGEAWVEGMEQEAGEVEVGEEVIASTTWAKQEVGAEAVVEWDVAEVRDGVESLESSILWGPSCWRRSAALWSCGISCSG